MSAVEARDLETRERLLTAATRLFADNGFNAVTVRDICTRANANVAAVNYHFNGKVGLYDQVMQSAIRIMQATTEQTRLEAIGQSPRDQLRTFVRVFITRVVAGSSDSWIHQLMMREIADPTPALGMVIEQVIRPRLAYLREMVATLMGVDPADPRVLACAFSVNAQCLALLHHKNAAHVSPVFTMDAAGIEAAVEHITCFSLAGIEAVSRSVAAPKPQRH